MDDFSRQFDRANLLLSGKNNILIASHENPDADAVGSALALNFFLKNSGFSPVVFFADPVPKKFSFLPRFFEIKSEFKGHPEFEAALLLDYGDFKRLKLPDGIVPEESMITIDHHSGDQRGEVRIVDQAVSSTAEMIYFWLKENPPAKAEISKETAVCLLCGIAADTGCFSHVSTGSKTLKAASDLLSCGMSLEDIVSKTLSSGVLPSPGSANIFGKILSRARTIPGKNLVYSWVSAADLKSNPSLVLEISGASSIISKESTCDYALFLVEYEKGKIRGSLRSEPFKNKKVDVVARKLGGGGHPYAAGFKQEGTIGEVLKKVIKMIE
jgi:phosphoesterase RecJ-like protein